MSVALGWAAVAASVGAAVLAHRDRYRHRCTHSARMAALGRCVRRSRCI